MTREEAIEILKYSIGLFPVTDRAISALKMAIKALEQEPCDDVISRRPPVTPKAEPQDLCRVIEDIEEEIKDLDYLVNDAKYSDAETRIHNVDYLMYEIYKILDKHKATRK